MPVEITKTETITCKNCGAKAVVRYGSYKGVPRYFCKICRRKFKADGSSFHGKVPLDYISSALSMYYSGMSINEIRSHLKQEHDYYPSKSVVFGWVNKYTDLASKQFRDYHPQVGDTWVADETMLDVDGQHKLWFYDIIDTDTRYLLASRVALSRTTDDAERLMLDAEAKAGKKPKEIVTDKNYAYLDGIDKAYGGALEHIQGSPFKIKASGESTSQIERFHGTLKDRTKVIRAFRDYETLKQFTDGWLIYYNYFKPHISLDGRTPAEEANISYGVKNWADLARIPVLKQAEIQSHKEHPSPQPKFKRPLEKAFKRKRKPYLGKPHKAKQGLGLTRRLDR